MITMKELKKAHKEIKTLENQVEDINVVIEEKVEQYKKDREFFVLGQNGYTFCTKCRKLIKIEESILFYAITKYCIDDKKHHAYFHATHELHRLCSECQKSESFMEWMGEYDKHLKARPFYKKFPAKQELDKLYILVKDKWVLVKNRYTFCNSLAETHLIDFAADLGIELPESIFSY